MRISDLDAEGSGVTYNIDPYQPMSWPDWNSAVNVGFRVATTDESYHVVQNRQTLHHLASRLGLRTGGLRHTRDPMNMRTPIVTTMRIRFAVEGSSCFSMTSSLSELPDGGDGVGLAVAVVVVGTSSCPMMPFGVPLFHGRRELESRRI